MLVFMIFVVLCALYVPSDSGSVCTITGITKGCDSTSGYCTNTYGNFYLNNVLSSISAGYGMNLVKFTSSSGSNCGLSYVGTYYGFTWGTGPNSTGLISALNALKDGDIAIAALTDTGSSFSTAAISSLQSTLGATVTSFSYRYAYVIIGQKPGKKLCEKSPALNTVLNCTVSLNMASLIPTSAPTTRVPTAVPSTASPTTKPPSATPTRSPTAIPSKQPTVTPTFRPTVTPTATPTTTPTFRPTKKPVTSSPTSNPSGHPSLTPSSVPTCLPSSHPTATPSRAPLPIPSSQPTSAPTDLDVILANAFSSDIDLSFVREKTQFYLGTFVAYFISLFVSLVLIEYAVYRSRARMAALYDSASASKIYLNISLNGEKSLNSCFSLRNVQNLNKLIEICSKNDLVIADKAQEDSEAAHEVAQVAVKSYPYSFYSYLSQKRCIQGCSALLCDEFESVYPCFHVKLPPGRYEDFLVQVCSTHRLFSCLYSPRNSPISSHGRKILYVAQYAVAFSLSQIFDCALFFGSSNLPYRYGVSLLLGLLVINPIALGFGSFIQAIWLRQYTGLAAGPKKWRVLYQLRNEIPSVLLAIPLLLLVFASLVISAVFSQGKNFAYIILYFFVKVQVAGVLLELWISFLAFKDNYHLHLRLDFLFKSLTIVCIGRLFCERIISEALVEGRDYTCKSYSLLCGCMQMDILNMADQRAVEMAANPLHLGSVTGTSSDAPASDAQLYMASEAGIGVEGESEREHKSVATNSDNVLVSYGNIYSVFDDEMKTSNGKVEVSTTMRAKLSAETALNSENDDEDCMTNAKWLNEQETMEELARNKRKFKDGTRKNFIEKLNAFEEDETNYGDNSYSLKNTLMLHSKFVKKNILNGANAQAGPK